MLTDRQKQILIGTVLGGSSLLKPPKGHHYYLAMRSKNDLWLSYKMEELMPLFKNTTAYKYGSTYRCYSGCCQELSDLRKQLFIANKRRVSLELFDELRLKDIGLAIWFLESGGKTGRNRKNAYLNTTIYGKKGSETIRDYFNLIECNCSVNKNKNRRRVVFSIKGTENLFKITAHCFPIFML
jgi:hypothetical protein